MNKRKAILLSIFILLSLAIAYLLLPLNRITQKDHNQLEEKESAEHPLPSVFSRLDEFNFINKNEEKFGYKDLLGDIWIAHFHFNNCDANCPKIINGLSQLRIQLKNYSSWNDIQIASFIPKGESIPSAFPITHEADENMPYKWNLLFGEEKVLNDLRYNGFKFKVDHLDHQLHKNQDHRVALVDRSMTIRGYYNIADKNEMHYLLEDIRHLTRLERERMAVPTDIINPDWIIKRKQQQIENSNNAKSYLNLSFEDKLENSGINWRHQIVDDSGLDYIACHYDHGNGVVVADVDSDGLLDIYFISQVGENQLWKNEGEGKFSNITELSPALKIRDAISVTGCFADIDNDGDSDLFVTTILSGNRLYENNGKGVFKDISEKSGVKYIGHSSGASFFDYNNDGLLDIFVSNVGVFTDGNIVEQSTAHPNNSLQDGTYNYYRAFSDAFAGHIKPERTETSTLYRNEGNNQFVDVSQEVKLIDTSWTGDSSPFDLNNDGWTDLFLVNMQGDDQYYENINGKYFVNKTQEYFPKTSWGSMGLGIFDFDNDEDFDIFVTDMHSDMGNTFLPSEEKLKKSADYSESILAGSHPIFGNSFFKNNGKGQFKEVSDNIGAENLWPWGLSIGDINADGFEDAYITSSMNYPFRYGVNSLLINEQGEKFIDAEYILNLEPRANKKTASWWYNMDETQLKKEIVDRKEVWGAMGSRSSVIFDLDNDGDLDIVSSEFNNPPRILISDLNSSNPNLNYIKIKLAGIESNRDGLGAIIKVKTENNIYTKLYNGKSGYISQSSMPIYFGLGQEKNIESITVKWPSGIVQSINEVLVNTQIVIEEKQD